LRLAFLSIGRHIHTERWIQWFAQRGHECHLLTVQPGDVPGVQVHDIRCGFGPKPLRYAFSLKRVKNLLGTIRPDLLNTHFLTGYGYWGHFSGFHPNVLTVWGDDIYVTPHENQLKGWLAGKALRSCDALTGDSADILKVAVTMGADPTKSFRVLWGVDLERFSPGDAASWRRQHGFGDHDVLYFSPRSFTQPYYNIDTIISAAAKVQAEIPAARFLFSGYEGDPAPFWELAAQAGITERSVFLGRIPHDEFAIALRAADVFLSVPSVDATAVSLLEAMACGTAIIISSLASSTEWIRDQVSGLVVPPRDVEALATAMLTLGRSESTRTELGRAARAGAEAHADFDTNMHHVDAIFQALLDKTQPMPSAVSLGRIRPDTAGAS
jgi:L-malate glycosyltransferase